MALRAKIWSDEVEFEGRGSSTAEDDNEAWLDFLRNPKGRGLSSPERFQNCNAPFTSYEVAAR